MRPDIFSPGAIDYIFRCTAGIPRAINNLCDNALLNGFAASEEIISRAIIQEVAETFDVLPRIAKVEERESPARVFPAASRAELWAAGNGNGNGGTGVAPVSYAQEPPATYGNGNGDSSSHHESDASEFSLISSENDPDIVFNELPRRFSESRPAGASTGGFDFNRRGKPRNPPAYAGPDTSGFGRGNNGQSL